MYKCNHCNITIPDHQTEGRIVKAGPKLYCTACGEPVEYVHEVPQNEGALRGAKATLISNSDNRITTNNYYGNVLPEEQVETRYGTFKRSDACYCKHCQQWVPFTFYNQERHICSDCEVEQIRKDFDDGMRFFESELYDEAVLIFLNYENVCSDDKELCRVRSLIGQCYYHLQQYKRAVTFFIRASKDNLDSLYYLGLCYYNGYGVEQNRQKAITDYFIPDCQQGHAASKAFIESLDLTADEGQNGLWGYRSTDGAIVIAHQFAAAGKFSEGFARVMNADSKWGYIDKCGNLILPYQWQFACAFYNGTAKVDDELDRRFLINREGTLLKELCTTCKQWLPLSNFREGQTYCSECEKKMVLENLDLTATVDENGKWGYINKYGYLVIPCQWQEADEFVNDTARVQDSSGKWQLIDKHGTIVWEDIGPMKDGRVRVRDFNGKYGYIDANNIIAITCKWAMAYDFNEGLAAVQDDSGKYGFIDTEGKVVIPCEWQNVLPTYSKGMAKVQYSEDEWIYIDKDGAIVWEDVGPLRDGLMRVRNSEGFYGYLDKDGNVAIECNWEWAEDFADGFALVGEDEDWGEADFIDTNGNTVWEDVGTLTEGLIKVRESQGYYGYIDKKHNIVIPCIWGYAYDFCDGLAVVQGGNNMYGYINTNGETVIECIWDTAFDFNHGLALVEKEHSEGSEAEYVYIDKEGKVIWEDAGFHECGLSRVRNAQGMYGYIDKDNTIAIAFQWKKAYDFSDGLAAVQDTSGKYGFIDTKGDIVIPCQWDSIEPVFKNGLSKVKNAKGEWKYIDKSGAVVWDNVGSLSEGLERVRDSKGLEGYLNEDRNIAIPCQWKSAAPFSEGMAAVMNSDEKYGFIDKTGTVVIPLRFNYVFANYYNGLAKVREDIPILYIDKSGAVVWKNVRDCGEDLERVCNTDGKYGYIDRAKKVVVPCQWKEANEFRDGLAAVKDFNDKYGYIDKTGTVVIPCQWKDVKNFSEGLAAVKDSDDKYGFISKDGKLVIQCQWRTADYFHNGIAEVEGANKLGFPIYYYINQHGETIFKVAGKQRYGLTCVIDSNNLYGFIDEKNKEAIPCQWKWAGDFKEELALVQDSTGKYGFIDKTGGCVIPCQWEEASSFIYGMAKVKNTSGKYGFIDKTGNIIVPCEWQNASAFCSKEDCSLDNEVRISSYYVHKDPGLACIQNSSGQYGYIDKAGNVTIPCQWGKAENFKYGLALITNLDKTMSFIDNSGNVVWKNVGVESERRQRVSNEEGKYGYLDSFRKIVIPCQWKMAYNFSNGLALVQDNKLQWFFIDEKGKIIWKDVSGPKDGLYRVCDSSYKYGYIDNKGKIVIACQWNYASPFKEGLAFVQDSSAKFGYIEKNGRIAIPCQWSSACLFCDGLALVKDSSERFGFIDKKGKVVVPFEWASANSFNYGLAPVLAKGTNWGFIKEKDKWGYINTKGNVVIPFKWKSAKRFYEKLAAVQDFEDKWGFIDKNGQVVIPIKWKNVRSFSKNLAAVQDSNDKWGFIDKNGAIVIPCKYKDVEVISERKIAVVDFNNNKRSYYVPQKNE